MVWGGVDDLQLTKVKSELKFEVKIVTLLFPFSLTLVSIREIHV
jgi:hypothetical protein